MTEVAAPSYVIYGVVVDGIGEEYP